MVSAYRIKTDLVSYPVVVEECLRGRSFRRILLEAQAEETFELFRIVRRDGPFLFHDLEEYGHIGIQFGPRRLSFE
jgi:hypothetical protein